ncbi:hypothetical protein [Vibrio sp. TBV020]|uniref:hypothetical protein n=1 Tax=Vibrio sp. TBV020 TaxID=3137398 RepID=UPI0038CD20FC
MDIAEISRTNDGMDDAALLKLRERDDMQDESAYQEFRECCAGDTIEQLEQSNALWM